MKTFKYKFNVLWLLCISLFIFIGNTGVWGQVRRPIPWTLKQSTGAAITNGMVPTWNSVYQQWFGAAGGGETPTAITVAPEASDTTCWPLFSMVNTGDTGPKTHASWTFNAATGMLTGTGFTGPVTGTASGNMPVPIQSTSLTPGVGTAGAKVYVVKTITSDASGVFGVPTGTPTEGQIIDYLLISDANGGWVLNMTTAACFQPIGAILPTLTIASKITAVCVRWNVSRQKWLVVAVNQEQ